MFKSTFLKYLTVFVVILLISFVILTAIITTTIRDYAMETKERSLIATCTALSDNLVRIGVEDIETYANSGLGTMAVMPIMNQDSTIKILLD